MRAWLAVLWLAGCGRLGFGEQPPADAAPPVVVGVVDGSRLRAERWVTDDGVAAFARWYDTVLDTPCDWDIVDGGHCLPHPFADAYADAACTIPAVRATPDCVPPKLTTLRSTRTVYELGDVVATPYGVIAGACAAVADGATYYTLGAPVALDRFVAGASVVTPVGDGFATVEIAGDDGSRQLIDLGTTADAGRCDLEANSAGQMICLPRVSDQLSEFTHTYMDSACTVEVVEDGSAAYATINFVADPCAFRAAAVGSPVAVTRVYVRDATGACVQRAMPATMVEPLSDPALPVWTSVDVEKGARLRASAWRSPGGALAPRWLYDTVLGVECRPMVDVDTGRAVCIPAGASGGTSASASASCGTMPVAVDFTCGPSVIATTTGETCRGMAAHLSARATPVQPPFSFVAGGTCVLINTTDAEVWASGIFGAYDSSGLAELTLVHD